MRAGALWGAVLLVLAPSAQAFKRSQVGDGGHFLYWDTDCVTYKINSQGCSRIGDGSEVAAIRRAFDSWNQAPCNVCLLYGGYTNIAEAGVDYQNVIVFHNDAWEYEPSSIALTTNIFNVDTGEIVDTDIELNGVHFNFTTTDISSLINTDVENTMAHEIGHFIGLDHTSVSQATMWAYAEGAEIMKRSLHQDDLDGVCTIIEGREGCGLVPGGGDSPVEMALLALLALLALGASRLGQSRQG